ncbi:hypothetical protein C8J57DRAFT_1432158 [Mycena rebaudengoi]|nr:hypothetical protein C8J57DRAFT_1432158 [Mycena rebaudengoi]
MSTLCLACSSSLPPKLNSPVFTTPCCNRPICPSCLASNPRLARYDPCLACLGGVELSSRNVDGAVRDEDTFVLGDSDEEEFDNDDNKGESKSPESGFNNLASTIDIAETTKPAPDSTSAPPKYYIKRGDTLQGISLRFGLDGRELCRLNNLPPSTLSTTPHILHTRTFITLPLSAQSKLSASDAQPNSAEEKAREVRRARERAEKRLQTLTKEVDWRVAKAYIALADDPEEVENFGLKRKEMGAPLNGGASSQLEAMAVDRYLDDLEWEANELKAGRSVHIPQYPSQSNSKEQPESSVKGAKGSWW